MSRDVGDDVGDEFADAEGFIVAGEDPLMLLLLVELLHLTAVLSSRAYPAVLESAGLAKFQKLAIAALAPLPPKAAVVAVVVLLVFI